MMRLATGRRTGALLLGLVAVALGAVVLVVALSAQRSAPRPTASGSTDPSPTAPPTEPSRAAPTGPVPLGASRPVSITIPAIHVRSRVQPIGLAKDGTLAVPQPGPHLDQAAWFDKSPTPGQPGPSIIEGHVDSEKGPSVFFALGRLHLGDKIHVTRSDGRRVTFTVHGVRNFPKSRFPTEVVYGAKDLSRPQLRLITCSNFDSATRHHTGNEVVFAHLTSVHR